ncbi:MAG: phosphate ABC transporter substrate-binding protein [Melioribacteraceae bacterium]|nr:phosphate ABC transporter substrate-binding protein [Melioribacteraceae bacterium]
MIKLIFISFIIIIISSCSFNQSKISSIRIVGSDTMFELVNDLVLEFNKEHPEIVINVFGGGSKYGIEALINGEADICTSSRKLYPDEAKKLVNKFNTLGVAHLVAIDALSIFVNRNNPIDNISHETLKNIFTGKIVKWSDLGFVNDKIQPVIRNIDSGTYLFFKEYVLDGEEYSNNCIEFNTTKKVVDFITFNINAIGYGGIGYAGEVKTLSVDGIFPNTQNILNNKYPYFRYLYFFTIKEPEGNLKLFIDWVISSKGQKIVEKSGYFPLWFVNE